MWWFAHPLYWNLRERKIQLDITKLQSNCGRSERRSLQVMTMLGLSWTAIRTNLIKGCPQQRQDRSVTSLCTFAAICLSLLHHLPSLQAEMPFFASISLRALREVWISSLLSLPAHTKWKSRSIFLKTGDSNSSDHLNCPFKGGKCNAYYFISSSIVGMFVSVFVFSNIDIKHIVSPMFTENTQITLVKSIADKYIL